MGPGCRVAASLLLACAFTAHAQTPGPSAAPSPGPQAAPAPAPAFDPKAATRDWLAKVPADQKARSDAYFEGG